MKYTDSKLLLEDFRRSLESNLTAFGFNKLLESWPDGKWTNFYKTDLFKTISDDLGLAYDFKEYLTIDALLYYKERDKDYGVPLVVIETENNIDSITEGELYKLCCINAPLKVIFTWCEEWNEEAKKIYIQEDWYFVLKMFETANQINGQLLFIIVENKSMDLPRFIFHSFTYAGIVDGKVNICEESKIEIAPEIS